MSSHRFNQFDVWFEKTEHGRTFGRTRREDCFGAFQAGRRMGAANIESVCAAYDLGLRGEYRDFASGTNELVAFLIGWKKYRDSIAHHAQGEA